MSPRSARSSLSHWTIVRSRIVAHSTGATRTRGSRVMTMPPEWMPMCLGKPSTRRHSCNSSSPMGPLTVAPATAGGAIFSPATADGGATVPVRTATKSASCGFCCCSARRSRHPWLRSSSELRPDTVAPPPASIGLGASLRSLGPCPGIVALTPASMGFIASLRSLEVQPGIIAPTPASVVRDA